MVGSQTSLQLARKFKTLDDLLKANLEQLQLIQDIGDKVSKSIFDYIHNQNNLHIIQKLLQAGVIIKYDSVKSSFWSDKKVCITGAFSKFNRQELKNLIETQGGNVVSQVTLDTDILLMGEKAGSKFDKAKKLGIKIITESELKI